MVDLEELEMMELGGMAQFEGEGLDGEDPYFEFGPSFELDNFDGEWGSYEAGIDPELEAEGWSTAFEAQDLESDPFLGNLMRKAGRTIAQNVQSGVSPQLLKSLAKQAAQVAGAAVAGRTGANIAGQVANQVLREAEFEGENWYESDPLMEVDSGLMEELQYNAAMAAESESKAESDQFIGAIANLAGPLLSSLMGESGDSLFEEQYGESEFGYQSERDDFLPALIPFAAPLLKKGVGALGKLFSRRRSTRRLVRTLPRVAAGAARDISRLRRPPTSRDVAAALARRTARVISSPVAVSQAMRQNRAAALQAQARPAYRGPGAYGSAATRRYPIFGSAIPGRGRRRVVGYLLKPVYSGQRVRV